MSSKILENSSKGFPVNWFPFGATLVSTMTRWGHYRQKLSQWIAEISFDLENMSKSGMNTVSIMMDWEMIEPDAGYYDFSRFDPIVEKAESLGLKVVLWPWEELCPEWIVRQHPDWLWEADDGDRPPMGCWLHPELQKRVHLFIRNVVENYRNSSSLFMWNVGIEPHYRNSFCGIRLTEKPNKLFCYNPETIKKFRSWLKNKYKDINNLNEKWTTYYKSWDQVQAVRHNPGLLTSARFFDWRLFYIDALADYQHSKAELVRKLDSSHPTTCNSGWDFGGFHAGKDMHRIVEGFDSSGISRFPIYHGGRALRSSNKLSYSYIRSTCEPDNKPYFVHELSGGPPAKGVDIGETPSPGEIAQWCWEAVSMGYRGIFFWAWRPHRAGSEAGGFGLVNMDGTDTPRKNAATKTSRLLQEIAPILNRLKPVKPEVAIVCSSINTILSESGKYFTENPALKKLHADSIKGYLQILSGLRIPVHMMMDHQLEELDDGNLKHIKFLILPYLGAIETDRLIALDKFAKHGGIIWSDPWLGQRDEANICRDTIPIDFLAKRFGCIQGQVRPVITDNPLNRANAWRGNSVIGESFCQVDGLACEPLSIACAAQEVALEPIYNGEVIGRFQNGKPGLVRKKTNNGTTYYSGSFFSIAAKTKGGGEGFEEQKMGGQNLDNLGETADSGFLKLFENILTQHNIYTPIEAVSEDSTDIEANLLVDKNEALAVFINYGQEKHSGLWRVNMELDVKRTWKAFDLISELEIQILSYTEDSVELKIEIPVYGVLAVRIS